MSIASGTALRFFDSEMCYLTTFSFLFVGYEGGGKSCNGLGGRSRSGEVDRARDLFPLWKARRGLGVAFTWRLPRYVDIT